MLIYWLCDLYAADIDHDPENRLLLIHDPDLLLSDDMVDVIVGEVKQGPARLNPAITRHECCTRSSGVSIGSTKMVSIRQ